MKHTISFYGFGNMGQALFNSMQHSPIIHDYNWSFYDPSLVLQEKFKHHPFLQLYSERELIDSSSIIFICVKPQQLSHVLDSLNAHSDSSAHLVSMLAGVTRLHFTHSLGHEWSVSRIMPNTPAKIREGVTAVAYDPLISDSDCDTLKNLLRTAGVVVEVDEDVLNTITAISGSGPAFIYEIMKSMIHFSKSKDIEEHVYIPLISQTLIGAAKMMLQYRDVEALIDSVSSPNGTTVAGLQTFRDEDIGNRLFAVFESAAKRAEELAEESFT